jgi:hypothetical protein
MHGSAAHRQTILSRTEDISNFPERSKTKKLHKRVPSQRCRNILSEPNEQRTPTIRPTKAYSTLQKQHSQRRRTGRAQLCALFHEAGHQRLIFDGLHGRLPNEPQDARTHGKLHELKVKNVLAPLDCDDVVLCTTAWLQKHSGSTGSSIKTCYRPLPSSNSATCRM